MQDEPIPAGVRAAFRAWWDTDAAVVPVADGLVNRTWAVGGPPRFALQRLAPLFGPAENARAAEAARLLLAGGLDAPEVLPTAGGAPGHVDRDGRVWRLTRWRPGRTRHRLTRLAQARSAGALLAGFHRLLAAAPEAARWPESRFHDTRRRMADLADSRESGDDAQRRLADTILALWEDRVAPIAVALPARPGHGDPKISNLLFDGDTARTVLDLDTVARMPVDDDLGDALRSWCNPQGEDCETIALEPALFEAALAGYLPVAEPTREERAAIVPGLARIALELAARFCADAAHGTYFAWSPAVAPDAPSHNLLRARGQLSLCRDVLARRAALEAVVEGTA